MPDLFTERLELLASSKNNPLLSKIQRGIEKESLRVDDNGKLAQTPHPIKLGAALTNPHITTDFSEALLEFITPVLTDIDESLEFLSNIHRYTYENLDGEILWAASMPCILDGDENIPVARYGNSNVATMKTVYRKGLGNRYGRLMQTISGIHYNFSIPQPLWDALQEQDLDKRSSQDYITDSYFKLIRNFRRYSWLLVYLYGASPAVCKSFLRGQTNHQLQEFDHGSFYLPYGTALRMGDLGYQSSAQENLKICYNSIDNYIETLRQAIVNIHPPYAEIGVKVDNNYKQLSSALLQIENEFYSPIRPKRVTESGETPLSALKEKGVEYIEVRCIDVNPYLPLGIDADQIRFIDCFLLYCLFNRSPLCDDDERDRIAYNSSAVVTRGREPGLKLLNRNEEVSLPDWGNQLLDGIDKVAKMLDDAHGGDNYQRICAEQRQKLDHPELTPSAKILADMKSSDTPFFKMAMALSKQHGENYQKRPLSGEDKQYFSNLTELSLQRQQEIESSDTINFDEYLASYYAQYENL